MLAHRTVPHGEAPQGGIREGAVIPQVIAASGLNDSGESGLGYASANLLVFTQAVELTSNGTVVKVASSAGGGQIYALLEDGDIWGAGHNNVGGLVDGTFINRMAPIKTLFTNIEDFETFGDGLLAKTKDGRILTGGSNPYGQIGNGEASGGNPELSKQFAQTTPHEVIFPSGRVGREVVQIAASNCNCAVVFNDGYVYAWGENNTGQVGDGTEETKSTPTLIWTPTSEGTKAVELAIGAKREGPSHVIMRLQNGRLMSWGNKREGACGVEPFTGQNLVFPTLVPAEPGAVNVAHVFAAYGITFTLTGANKLWVFGTGKEWCHGLGPTVTPTTIIWPPREVRGEVASVASEGHTTAVVTTTGKLCVCGANQKKQLGLGESPPGEEAEAMPTLTEVPGIFGVTQAWVSIYTIQVLCEHCEAQPIFSLAGKKRALASTWNSAGGAGFEFKWQNLGHPTGQTPSESSGEDEAEVRLRRLFLGAVVANGLGFSGGATTITGAWGKTTTYPTAPASSPGTSDSTGGHYAEAHFNFTTTDGKELLRELAEGATIVVGKYRFYGVPASAKPKVGFAFTSTGERLSAALSTAAPITSLSIHQLKLPIPAGTTLTLNDGAGHTQAWVTSAEVVPEPEPRVHTFAIPVVSQKPNFAFPSGCSIEFRVHGEIPLTEGAVIPQWWKLKTSNQELQELTKEKVEAASFYGETGASNTWTGTEAYVEFELESPIEGAKLAETARSYTVTTYKGVELEPGDLYEVKVGKGPPGFANPVGREVVQGARSPEDLVSSLHETGTLQIEAWGAVPTGAFVARGLPPGAVCNPDTGLISFTLTKGGTYAVAVEVIGIDGEGDPWTDTASFSWEVS